MNALVEGVGAGSGAAVDHQIETGKEMLDSAAADAGGPLKQDARERPLLLLRP